MIKAEAIKREAKKLSELVDYEDGTYAVIKIVDLENLIDSMTEWHDPKMKTTITMEASRVIVGKIDSMPIDSENQWRLREFIKSMTNKTDPVLSVLDAVEAAFRSPNPNYRAWQIKQLREQREKELK